jgi:hypothetical protein
MFSISRRSLIHSLFSLPSALIGSSLVAVPEVGCESNSGTLNLHLEGPFAFVSFKNKKRMYVLGPNAPYHHLPAATWATGEAEVKELDYELVGPTANAGDPEYRYPDPNVKVDRLQVSSQMLGLDVPNKKIDVDRRRFFSLLVPMPARIVPWHPILVNVGGTHSPFPTTKVVRLPVGYTFIYEGVRFSDVHIRCLTNAEQSLGLEMNPKDDNLHLCPYPGQKHVDLYVQMESSEDADPDHSFAKEGFAACCAMFTHLDLTGVSASEVNVTKNRLDLTLTYLPPERGHTGSDCKATVVEIVGVDETTGLGNGTYGG